MSKSLVLLVAVALFVPQASKAAAFDIDPAHSAATFSVKHLMVANVHGEFGKVTGTVNLDDKDITKSTVEATLDATSIRTHDEKRDEHLKSAEFFDVAKFPTLTFRSTKVEKGAKGKLKVTGDLTIHGVTKSVVLDVEGLSKESKDPWGNVKVGTSASTKINRKDFGLTWNKNLETGGVLVGEEVTINLDVELGKKVAEPPAK